MGYAIPQTDIKHGVTAIAASTNFPSGAAPQVLSGAAILLANVAPGTLGALVTVDAETNTLTASAKWQVSSNGTTWYDVVPTNNAANVVLMTGTSGADTAVTAFVPAGDIYAWKYGRIQLYTGVGSSTTGDLGGATYSYRENTRY